MAEHQVRVLSWLKASELDIRSGLLGYISVEYGTLILDGICLRRSAAGRFILSFPARTDRAGRRHSYIRPADDAARKAIEHEILVQLGQHPNLAAAAEDRP